MLETTRSGVVAAAVLWSSFAFAAEKKPAAPPPATAEKKAPAPVSGAPPQAKAPPKKHARTVVTSRPPAPVAPLPAGEKAAWSHAPFEAGDCTVCHATSDPKNPGPLKKAGNDICYMCHEEVQAIMARKFKHAPAVDKCVACHNPHNARERKLLVAEQAEMCFACHRDIEALAKKSPVKHVALDQASKCVNCHNPHAANVELLLQQLPFDLCKGCHSRDNVSDGRGSYLTNFTTWLKDNKNWHEPVRLKDCSACHVVHGGEHFRLLTMPYPKTFYAGYDPKNYALCFSCHNDRVVAEAETASLTAFRDGTRNLHYLHVNKPERGRTCRACHEVHASKQDHHLREGVPFGPTGWILKLNYTKNAAGGQCAKTCHETLSYNNRSVAADATPRK